MIQHWKHDYITHSIPSPLSPDDSVLLEVMYNSHTGEFLYGFLSSYGSSKGQCKNLNLFIIQQGGHSIISKSHAWRALTVHGYKCCFIVTKSITRDLFIHLYVGT